MVSGNLVGDHALVPVAGELVRRPFPVGREPADLGIYSEDRHPRIPTALERLAQEGIDPAFGRRVRTWVAEGSPRGGRRRLAERAGARAPRGSSVGHQPGGRRSGG